MSIREKLQVSNRDWGMAIGSGLFVALFTVAAAMVGSGVSLAVGLSLASAVVTFWLLSAVRRISRAVETNHIQTRALLSVVATLEPSAPLPAMTSWAITPDVACLLCELILDRHPKVIVECGAGSSTVVNARMLQRLGEGGKVYAIESYEGSIAAARALIRRHGLESHVELIHAPLREQELGGYRHNWYDVKALPDIADIDILFVDGPAQYGQPDAILARYGALPHFISRMRKGAVVVLDDASRATEREMARRWAQDYGVEVESLDGFARGVILLHVR